MGQEIFVALWVTSLLFLKVWHTLFWSCICSNSKLELQVGFAVL